MKTQTLSATDYEQQLAEAKITVYRPPFRNTFGIVDPATGEKYPDIVKCHLEARSIQLEEFLIDRHIAEALGKQKKYKILLDHKAFKKLIMKGYIDALVSFQTRTDANIAVVRLFDPSKVMKQDSI